MINVGLITSWNDKCGISEYAAHLVQYINDPDIRLEVLPTSIHEHFKSSARFDIIHVNECGWVMNGFHQDQLFAIRARGEKTLLTCHTSHPVNSKNSLTQLFDHVVTHEEYSEDGFHHIPQGVPVYPISWIDDSKNYIATQGFPFEHKNLLPLAEACERAHFSLLAMIAESHHVDAYAVKNEILARNPTAEVDTSWKTDKSIMDTMRLCTASCFPYSNRTPGPSSAANYGIAVRRPLIVSRCNQFSHLKGHEDEVYFIESAAPTANEIYEVLCQVREENAVQKYRTPSRLYEAMRWDKCGQLYAKLYKEIAAA